nr:hypothetical protein GCM10017611_79040 [Rhodococcus wratislaviensis]
MGRGVVSHTMTRKPLRVRTPSDSLRREEPSPPTCPISTAPRGPAGYHLPCPHPFRAGQPDQIVQCPTPKATHPARA